MSERLDRIEANIERVSQKLEALADNQISLQNNQESLSKAVEVMSQTVTQNSVTCAQLTQEINASVADLVSMIGQIADTGEENRQEIRRIWEYLMGQSGNGNGRSENG
ncbi:MAG: hypothetical protein MJK14_19615 [Rivularia sp. ALOHA_DT_140]|nr:hypothetical protein [Rivularia sp. ALOHA_DT_140]